MENMSGFQDPRIWDYIAMNANSAIEAGGWYNSFDGTVYSEMEMEQYIENTYEKLKPYLGKEKIVVEIGCASGLTMFRIAPYVGKYIGTDMAKVNLQKNRERINRENISNIELCQCSADKIGDMVSDKVDIVIINSVCQYFPDMEYFEKVLEETLGLLKASGALYLGDLLDRDLLKDFEKELTEYQIRHQEKKVKTDRSDELWIRRSYFNKLLENNQVKDIIISDKRAVVENELTKYRYDVVILVQ